MADFTARIKPKKSSTPGEAPQASDLEVAEIAVNTADGKLFVKHTDDSIKEISGSGGGATAPKVFTNGIRWLYRGTGTSPESSSYRVSSTAVGYFYVDTFAPDGLGDVSAELAKLQVGDVVSVFLKDELVAVDTISQVTDTTGEYLLRFTNVNNWWHKQQAMAYNDYMKLGCSKFSTSTTEATVDGLLVETKGDGFNMVLRDPISLFGRAGNPVDHAALVYNGTDFEWETPYLLTDGLQDQLKNPDTSTEWNKAFEGTNPGGGAYAYATSGIYLNDTDRLGSDVGTNIGSAVAGDAVKLYLDNVLVYEGTLAATPSVSGTGKHKFLVTDHLANVYPLFASASPGRLRIDCPKFGRIRDLDYADGEALIWNATAGKFMPTMPPTAIQDLNYGLNYPTTGIYQYDKATYGDGNQIYYDEAGEITIFQSGDRILPNATDSLGHTDISTAAADAVTANGGSTSLVPFWLSYDGGAWSAHTCTMASTSFPPAGPFLQDVTPDAPLSGSSVRITFSDPAGAQPIPLADGDLLVWDATDSLWKPSSNYISIPALKTLVAGSTDFVDFKARVAAL